MNININVLEQIKIDAEKNYLQTVKNIKKKEVLKK